MDHQAELSVVQPVKYTLSQTPEAEEFSWLTHLLSPLVSNLEKPSSIYKTFIAH